MSYNKLRIAKIVEETPDARSFVLEIPADLADKYRDSATFERAATLAWTQAQVQLHHLGIEPSLRRVACRIKAFRS